MRVKIVSDGKHTGTAVVNAETGELLQGVVSVSWSVSVKGSVFARAVIEVVGVPVEVVGEQEDEMIGDFKIMGDDCYLVTNDRGTLEKLPKLRWWWVLWFAFKNSVLGRSVRRSEVDAAIKGRRS